MYMNDDDGEWMFALTSTAVIIILVLVLGGCDLLRIAF